MKKSKRADAHLFVKFVSDDPEKSVVTFLLTAAVSNLYNLALTYITSET